MYTTIVIYTIVGKHKLKNIIIILIAFSTILPGCKNAGVEENRKSNENDPFVTYLKNNWLTPEDYVINKLNDHDYVIIGEYHYFKHDVDLIKRLIPKLYENGIYNLALEFGAYPYQYLVDSLLDLPQFDRKLAQKIIFNSQADWPYKEYIDIYEEAWKVNHSASSDTNVFRILNAGYTFDPCKNGLERFGGHNPDVYMADNILREIVSKNEKALIYSGAHHAFTKYYQPNYSFELDTLFGLNNSRMGNVLYDTLEDKVFNIYLHAPWISAGGFDELTVLPVMGVIDTIMQYFQCKPVGFDVYDSPFGKLTSNNTYYAFGYEEFNLGMFCDGYIYQHEFKDYECATLEMNYITYENLDELKVYLRCDDFSDEELDSLSIENANEYIYYDVLESIRHLMK